jgi:hypothetical protein
MLLAVPLPDFLPDDDDDDDDDVRIDGFDADAAVVRLAVDGDEAGLNSAAPVRLASAGVLLRDDCRDDCFVGVVEREERLLASKPLDDVCCVRFRVEAVREEFPRGVGEFFFMEDWENC